MQLYTIISGTGAKRPEMIFLNAIAKLLLQLCVLILVRPLKPKDLRALPRPNSII